MTLNYFPLKESTDANTDIVKWLFPHGLQAVLQVQAVWIVHINFGLSFSLSEKNIRIKLDILFTAARGK